MVVEYYKIVCDAQLGLTRFFINMIIFRHLKLEIALAILALNDEK